MSSQQLVHTTLGGQVWPGQRTSGPTDWAEQSQAWKFPGGCEVCQRTPPQWTGPGCKLPGSSPGPDTQSLHGGTCHPQSSSHLKQSLLSSRNSPPPCQFARACHRHRGHGTPQTEFLTPARTHFSSSVLAGGTATHPVPQARYLVSYFVVKVFSSLIF